MKRKLLNRARQMIHKDTPAERFAWGLLRHRRMFGLKFNRQVPIDKFIVDFYCYELQLVIELNGLAHDDPYRIRRDQTRDTILRELGYRILRVPNGMVLEGQKDFADAIRGFIPSPGPSGHPLPEGEGSTHGISK